MKIAPIPDDMPLVDGQSRARLGPPPGMSSHDCATVDIIRSHVTLPSGRSNSSVVALVELEDGDLEAIRAAGGRFWIEFLGQTFPPVLFGVFVQPEAAISNETEDE